MLTPATPSGTAAASADAGNGAAVAKPQKKKFHNGWTKEIETLMAEWADKAVCYRWMHERSERTYYAKDLSFMFPVIILSTVTGAANFALDSVISDPDNKKYAQLGLGGLSILTGIISTIANRLGYASRSESHKGAAISWGKFQRLIAIELSLHPDERSDCMHCLKMCRTELDRLIEQSPTLPDDVINACRVEFSKYPGVRKPEIVGDIKTTSVFIDTNARAKKLAQEASLMIAQKKGTLKQIVLDDLEPRIQRVIEFSTLPALREELREEAKAASREAVAVAMALPKAGVVGGAAVGTGAGTGAGTGLSESTAAAIEEARASRAEEVQRVALSGVVKAMRERLAASNARLGITAPPGIGAVLGRVQDISGEGSAVPERIVHIPAAAAAAAAAAADLDSSSGDEKE